MNKQLHLFLILFTLILVYACTGKKQTGNADDTSHAGNMSFSKSDEDRFQITCWGVGDIDLDDDMASLEEKFGKENISQDSLFLEGMFETMITVLWKDKPEEISIRWKDNAGQGKTIDFLEIYRPGSPYHFANGIKIGTKLDEIVALNGDKPVFIYGFGWDYGGTFVDFGEGKLKGDIPCFGGVFGLDDEKSADGLSQILGDQKISSSHPVLKKHSASLLKIRIMNKS